MATKIGFLEVPYCPCKTCPHAAEFSLRFLKSDRLLGCGLCAAARLDSVRFDACLNARFLLDQVAGLPSAHQAIKGARLNRVALVGFYDL